MNVSEVEKALTDAYYWLSMYKSGAITEGVTMEKVKEVIFAQSQLSENQQIVLDGLKFIFVNYNREFGNDGNIKYALRDLYWYLGTDYSVLENKKLISMCESYYLLSSDEFSQVLEVFSKWALEQEEG